MGSYHLVNPPELVGGTEKTGQMSFDVFDVVEFGSQRVVDVDGDDFPVRFTFIKKSHCSKNLDLFDLAWVANLFANFTHVKGIVVTLCFGLRVCNIRILPRLLKLARSSEKQNCDKHTHTKLVKKGRGREAPEG